MTTLRPRQKWVGAKALVCIFLGMSAMWSPVATANPPLPATLAQANTDADDVTPLLPVRESLTQPLPVGLWVDAGVSGAWIARDPHVGGHVGLGVETDRFALHLRLPVWFRLYDLPPVDAPLNRAPTPIDVTCQFVRCAEWTDGGDVDWGALSRVLHELRLGDDRDAIFVRGGPLHGHLGTGQLINEVWGSPAWDERQAGVYARAKLPVAQTQFEVLAPGILNASQLFGGRASAMPLKLVFEDEGETLVDEALAALSRVSVAAEFAADLTLPLRTPEIGRAIAPTTTRPLLAGAVEATWDLFPTSWWIQATPIVSSSAMYGLSTSGQGAAELGAGIGGGGRLRLSFPYVAGLVEGVAGVQTGGHRAGVFGGLYLFERRTALGTRSPAIKGLGNVGAPGGGFYRGAATVVVADLIRLGSRFQIEDAVGANVVEAWADVALWSFRGGARVIRRDVATDRDLASLVFGGTTLVALEGRWGIWGPFAATARVQRLPRNLGRSFSIDDDVFIGAEAAFVFGVERSLFGWQ